MLIKLKFFYDIPEGEHFFDPSTIQFCNEYFAQSINAFNTFFSSTDIDFLVSFVVFVETNNKQKTLSASTTPPTKHHNPISYQKGLYTIH